MEILLTHGYFLGDDPIEQRIMKPYVPLGILSIGTYLSQKGFAVKIFDSTFQSIDAFQNYMQIHKPPVVGIYINMMTKFSALKMISIAKLFGAIVVVGGPEPASYAEEFIDHGVDIVVIGEGEITLESVLHQIRIGSSDYSEIDGIIFREDGNIIRTEPRAFISELDQLPIPDRSQIDVTPYLEAWQKHHGYTSLSVISMRGCPYTCSWCSHAVYGESYRRRSAHLVADEIELLQSTFHPDLFWFADDVFTINHKWLFDFEKELLQRKIKIKYECITRADRMNESVVSAMKNTGCIRLWIGSESGSQKILDSMSRGVQVEQVQSMTKLAQKNGIEVGMFIMLGYKDEISDDIERTIRHLKIARPEHVLTTIAYPIKGTAFYQEIESRLEIPQTDWSEWNDRMIDFTGRYSKKYYWYANRRIVNEAKWSRLMNNEQKDWFSIGLSFSKAKLAQIGMKLS